MSKADRFLNALSGQGLPPLKIVPPEELTGYVHGTTKERAEKILAQGFQPGRARGNYGFAEWSFGATYLGREGDMWYGEDTVDPDQRGIGDNRLVRYEEILDAEISPTARIVRLESPDDAEALAKHLGYPTFAKLASDLRREGEATEKALETIKGFDLDGVDVRMLAWYEKNNRIGQEWEQRYGVAADPEMKELYKMGWSNFIMVADQMAVFNQDILRARRRIKTRNPGRQH